MYEKKDKMDYRSQFKRILYDLSIIAISVSVLYFAFIAVAGNLTPPATGNPVASMRTIEDVYKVFADPAYISGAAPKENGNVLEILKCITTKMNQGSCT